MKKTLMLTVICGAVLVAAVAAQNNQSRPDRPVGRLTAAIDANHDGTISGSEIERAPTALKTLDANGDGRLSGDELRPAFAGRGRRGADGSSGDPQAQERPSARRGGPDESNDADRGRRGGRGGGFGNPIVRALDQDRDGSLSDAEMARAGQALKALDVNSDGQISTAELRPAPRREGNSTPDKP